MIILTAVGPDHPGMVHAVASVLSRLGCNIEDATMTRLYGEFAMILIVAPPEGVGCELLRARLAPLSESHRLTIHCNAIEHEKATASDRPRHILSVYGPDQIGLVESVSRVLAEHQVNITDLQTRVASGGLLYVMVFEIELPPALSVDALEEALDRAGQQINVQMTLQPLEVNVL